MEITGTERQGSSGIAEETWGNDTVHRTGEPLGERVKRVVQREASGRIAHPGDLLHA